MQRPRLSPGQEWVWDYPRPPALQDVAERVRVVFAGETIADSTRCQRVLETSHPPVYYIPVPDVRMDLLHPEPHHRTFCEWKGRASYYSIQVPPRAPGDLTRRSEFAAWTYPDPTPPYRAIAGWIAFYPSRVDAAYLDDEPVTAQEGDFYGGWITPRIVGPFKGDPGTLGW